MTKIQQTIFDGLGITGQKSHPLCDLYVKRFKTPLGGYVLEGERVDRMLHFIDVFSHIYGMEFTSQVLQCSTNNVSGSTKSHFSS